MVDTDINCIISALEHAHKYKIVHLGIGNSFKMLPSGFLGWAFKRIIIEKFNESPKQFQGWDAFYHYFAPLDSAIARLNGHFPKAQVISRKINL